MTDFVIEADLRETTGRGEARRLRRAGLTPAVIYGGDKPELAITINTMSTAKLLDQEAFYSSIVELKVKGSRGSNKALVKDVQWHPVRDEAIHIDFYRVSSSDMVHMEVPLHAVNAETCPGVKKGGLLEIIRHTLEVTCRADSIPEHIDVSCDGLEVGDSLHIEDVALPDGVQIQHEVNFTVLTIAAPKVEKASEEEEEAEVETAAADSEAEKD
ncbi:MAG: 50S ribosomal protein L25 [Zetaproteobacteria bacterium CG12_big_fil_rev_8_21_14_0_65_55_1124]|nr:MAG: 50S ribosomal protein L25/general stress protein Ctc [Zetaproteobacteria bacterium CG1_02_55_237]PIS19469.1 MAG: 50S ribosomal protein L25 [Zetaproteobacteria bacterium CG08_land_8_20_14_0_20_55_17]PIW42303.1 MAG: 50S ribosomal protein L25 [Zetaproteobacteria bacterium CG12_big_fil_rev_8_21_14_0_65_55_1124]PIY52537.1 MAG: 50S ribosomal protein L25 [Zetaproteobacteria bacterium CG_4_10_14_0_8_um_filter_55_43]PIZ36911.1 MAG: 50S ribosomal protein L25 [Zetaproteobacteria bacterium CG_4_10_